MLKASQFPMIVSLIFAATSALTAPMADPLPGRVGSEGVQWVQLGIADLFFYMTPEKNELIQTIVQDINQEKIGLTVDINDYDCFTTELSATASKYPDPLQGQNGLYLPDPTGQAVLDSFSASLRQLMKDQIGLNMEGFSREINFVVNQDAHKFHQDQSTKQFTYLNERDPSLPPCTIVQDLTLVDWDMSADTLSATILQDALSEERFLLTLFPKEAVGMIFAQSPTYLTREAHPSYKVPTIFPYHAVLSPIDRKGAVSAGSSKGKRLSTVVRGVVAESEMEALKANSAPLSLNRPTFANDTWTYPEGMIAKKLSVDVAELLERMNQGPVYKHPDQEGVAIYELGLSDRMPIVQQLAEQFAIDPNVISSVKLIRVTKKDAGFSAFSQMNLPIAQNSEVILFNSSAVPEGCDYFNLARDFTVEGLPWIQLYYFPGSRTFKTNGEELRKLSLTPIEEVLFRKAKEDCMKTDGIYAMNKIITNIDLLVFEKR